MIIIAKETLGFRCAGILSALWLLMPTFSLPNAPPDAFRPGFTALGTLPYPEHIINYVLGLIFGTKLSPGNLRRKTP